MAVASLVVTPWFLVRMPADYFKTHKPHLLDRLKASTVPHCLLICLKNLTGLLLLVLGIAMLALPGQGVLTLIVAVCLLDFPKKMEIEAKLVSRPKVLRTVNWLRRKAGRPDLEI
jgi:hypothetical protein